MRNIFIMVLLALALVCAKSVLANLSEILIQDFSSQSPVYIENTAIMRLYQNFSDTQTKIFLANVWNGNKREYPSLSWNLLEKPDIKLKLAAVWIQMLRIGNDLEKLKKAREYVLKYTNDSNIGIRIIAIESIGYTGNQTDINRLGEFVLTGHINEKVAAAEALQNTANFVKNPSKISAILSLKTKVNDIHVLSIILSIQATLKDIDSLEKIVLSKHEEAAMRASASLAHIVLIGDGGKKIKEKATNALIRLQTSVNNVYIKNVIRLNLQTINRKF